MRFKLEYGRTGLEVDLPTERIVRTLQYKDAPPLPDPAGSLTEMLASPIASPPLAEIARGKKNACIAICDITRPVPNELILRPVLRTLEEAGIARQNIIILVATGLHRPNLGAELVDGLDCVEIHERWGVRTIGHAAPRMLLIERIPR